MPSAALNIYTRGRRRRKVLLPEAGVPAQKENQLSGWAGLEECMRISMWSISSSGWTYVTVTSEDQQQTQVGLGKWVWTLVRRTCLDPSTQGPALLEEEWAPDTPSHALCVPTSPRQPGSYSTMSCCCLDLQLCWKTQRTAVTVSFCQPRPREVM